VRGRDCDAGEGGGREQPHPQANNGLCGVGVAMNCSIGGIRMLDGRISDTLEGRALSFALHSVDIFSSSWGPSDDGATVWTHCSAHWMRAGTTKYSPPLQCIGKGRGQLVRQNVANPRFEPTKLLHCNVHNVILPQGSPKTNETLNLPNLRSLPG
jgi:hypothetical protein